MQELLEMYRKYFKLTSERYDIQHHTKSWKQYNLESYEQMGKRVQALFYEITDIRKKIEEFEKKVGETVA